MSRASAQVVLPERQCVQAFLSACATLQFIDFSNTGGGTLSNGVLTLIVSNTSDGTVEVDAFVNKLVFDMTGAIPEPLALAWAEWGTWSGNGFTASGVTEQWNVKKTTKVKGGVQVDLSVKDGGQAPQIDVGDAVMITIEFTDAFAVGLGLGCDDPVDCQAWSAEMKGLGGAGGTGHGFTTTSAPEPVTVILLATGLVGLAGAGAVRRRRQNKRRE